MPLPRIEHWELHLHNFIDRNKNRPFEWGSWDCGLFAAGAIEAETGVDVGELFRLCKYTTRTGAGKAIKAITHTGFGIQDAAQWIASTYGLVEVPILFGQRGDLFLFQGEEGWAAGVIGMDGKNVTFVGEGGLRKVPVKSCAKAWRVG